MMPSGHKAFLVSNVNDVELLLMHNKTYAAEYVISPSRTEGTCRRQHCSGQGHAICKCRLTRTL